MHNYNDAYEFLNHHCGECADWGCSPSEECGGACGELCCPRSADAKACGRLRVVRAYVPNVKAEKATNAA